MSLRVLVVDDEPAVRMLLSYALSDAQFDVETAATGREGLTQLHTGRYNVVFVDLNLPDMSGDELVARIRCAHPDLPLVMMTAEPEHLIPSRRQVDAYLNKPFRLAALEDSLSRAITAHQPRAVG